MTYDYFCDSCRIETTTERSIHSEASNPTCSECHQIMSRVFAVGGIAFRGTGWGKSAR